MLLVFLSCSNETKNKETAPAKEKKTDKKKVISDEFTDIIQINTDSSKVDWKRIKISKNNKAKFKIGDYTINYKLKHLNFTSIGSIPISDAKWETNYHKTRGFVSCNVAILCGLRGNTEALIFMNEIIGDSIQLTIQIKDIRKKVKGLITEINFKSEKKVVPQKISFNFTINAIEWELKNKNFIHAIKEDKIDFSVHLVTK